MGQIKLKIKNLQTTLDELDYKVASNDIKREFSHHYFNTHHKGNHEKDFIFAHNRIKQKYGLIYEDLHKISKLIQRMIEEYVKLDHQASQKMLKYPKKSPNK